MQTCIKQTMFDLLDTAGQFALDHVVTTFVSSFFTVVGGATPIAILVYFFSKKEKALLKIHADTLEKNLPLQEKLLEKYANNLEKLIGVQSLEKNMDNIKAYIESQNMVEENKKFINYARGYNFISAIGHILRMANYMPKNMNEHKEVSKNFLNSH